MSREIPDVLRKILARKAEEVDERTRKRSLADIEGELRGSTPARGFAAAMAKRVTRGEPAVIA